MYKTYISQHLLCFGYIVVSRCEHKKTHTIESRDIRVGMGALAGLTNQPPNVVVIVILRYLL